MSHQRADHLNEALRFPGWTAAWDEAAGVWHMAHETGFRCDVAESEVPPDVPFVHGVIQVLAQKRTQAATMTP